MLTDKKRNEQATDFEKINNNLKTSFLLFLWEGIYIVVMTLKNYGHIKILIIYFNFKTV